MSLDEWTKGKLHFIVHVIISRINYLVQNNVGVFLRAQYIFDVALKHRRGIAIPVTDSWYPAVLYTIKREKSLIDVYLYLGYITFTLS